MRREEALSVGLNESIIEENEEGEKIETKSLIPTFNRTVNRNNSLV